MGYRWILICLLLLIVWNLMRGLSAMISPSGTDRARVVRALSMRIGLSLIVFFLLMVGWAMGWWSPHQL